MFFFANSFHTLRVSFGLDTSRDRSDKRRQFKANKPKSDKCDHRRVSSSNERGKKSPNDGPDILDHGHQLTLEVGCREAKRKEMNPEEMLRA